MLQQEKVLIKWTARIKKHYKSLGYKWTKIGDQFEVKISDLFDTSSVLVEISCDECNKIFTRKWKDRLSQFKKHKKDLCPSCAKKGIRNSQYNKDRKEILKYARSFQKENPMKNKKHSKESKMKMSISKAKLISKGLLNIKSNNRGIKMQHVSIKSNEIFYADSALEKLRMIQLDNDPNVKYWTKRHGIKIPYYIDNEMKNYIPDFYIELINGNIIIEETKGQIKEVDLIKKDYAEKFCSHNNYIYKFTTQKEMNINGEYRKFLKKIKENK